MINYIVGARGSGKTTQAVGTAIAELCSPDSSVLFVSAHRTGSDHAVSMISNTMRTRIVREISSPVRQIDFDNGSTIRFAWGEGRWLGTSPSLIVIDDADHVPLIKDLVYGHPTARKLLVIELKEEALLNV